MLHRVASIFLAMTLCLAALPFGSTAVTQAQRDQMIDIVPVDDGNPYTDEFSGGYWTGGQYVGLDAYSVTSDPYYVPMSDGSWEERVDYLYADGNMSKSDGSPLSYSVRELDRSVSQNLLYITLDGVTLTFNLNTGDEVSVSDADLELLNNWVVGQDGRLVQDTGNALIQQGNQLEKETYLNYGLVAMLVDTNPPAETALKILDKGGKSLRSTRASFMRMSEVPVGATSMSPCRSPANSLVSSGGLFKPLIARIAQGSCFGGCGWGCSVIRNRFGFPIYGGPCIDHDRCTRSNGNRPFARPCLRSFGLSALYVILSF